jgi:ABC-2 type transport system permease protein
MALRMFFSSVIYPMPKVILFTLGGREIGLYDILPTTHAVAALNKILTLGADLSQVTFELSALVILSVLYFALGVCLFKRFHLRP